MFELNLIHDNIKKNKDIEIKDSNGIVKIYHYVDHLDKGHSSISLPDSEERPLDVISVN